MTQPRQAHAVIRREVVRLRRPRKHPIHPGYTAIVAKSHELDLPTCYPTDITIHDRLLIIERQPRQFAWLLHRCGSLLSLPEPNQRPWITCTPRDGFTVMHCRSGGMAAPSSRHRISTS